MAFPRAPLLESIPFTWATHQLATPLTNNPQEHAKKFLHHGSENDRYKFFLQGVCNVVPLPWTVHRRPAGPLTRAAALSPVWCTQRPIWRSASETST